MTIDATFWVAVSFFIFFGCLVYLKIPQKINNSLTDQINKMKKELDEAEKLKVEAKNLLRISLIFWGIFTYISPPKNITKDTATQKVASIVIVFISISF